MIMHVSLSNLFKPDPVELDLVKSPDLASSLTRVHKLSTISDTIKIDVTIIS